MTEAESSLPLREAWIEIITYLPVVSTSAGRFPCGKRGLKFIGFGIHHDVMQSLPLREAWIEIYTNFIKKETCLVASLAGSVD